MICQFDDKQLNHIIKRRKLGTCKEGKWNASICNKMSR